ncbi:MAG: hypothetical protein ABIA75_05585 [Candidatus Neomarinimicrobiota bacterium]
MKPKRAQASGTHRPLPFTARSHLPDQPFPPPGSRGLHPRNTRSLPVERSFHTP